MEIYEDSLKFYKVKISHNLTTALGNTKTDPDLSTVFTLAVQTQNTPVPGLSNT
jgi:hypothetical protein